MINPFKSKKGLGRGLSSLIGDSEKIDDKKMMIKGGKFAEYDVKKDYFKVNGKNLILIRNFI